MARVPGELTNTLVLALSQCQDQVRTIQEQSARIERLQRENERLRKELQDAKQEQPAAPAQEPEENVSSQVDDLFHKNVEAQAEIHKLKRKLRSYKEKANGRLGVPISSPLSLPATPFPSSPKQNKTTSAEVHASEYEQSPPRKRTRLNDTGVLHEIPANTAHSRTSSTATSKRSDVEKKVAAIPMVAEDGEDYVGTVAVKSPKSVLNKENSVYRRLNGLLEAPSPGRAPLARPRSISPSKEPPASTTRRTPAISNIKHISTEVPPLSSAKAPQRSSRTLAPENTPIAKSRPTSSTGRTSLGRSFRRDPEDEEPLRARPVTRLSLQHFKPNPRWLDSHGMSYDEFLHGPNADRIKTLAETLPKVPGQDGMSDDEILLDYLGPGSEARVAALTELAKKNLLAEAKLRRTAQSFAKVRADYDREKDPPGFWSTDMPGTQEDEENKEKARKMEREEVKRRYEDAVRGQGRWIFADE
ncbi:hypothetical protein PMZ80_010746 [Knufia obscura]|uniref:DNA endonuclease activator Ctp1 C-terminal domain-containing protein n=1 Tax=Knufia obscura TaxID=1635080 RepID=A0ABR0R9Q2_9EURO|nr:hypothetical protein PMZ80_010746 [Knufia obscura]